ncbi:MAG TPA: hypothetical protein VI279_11545 [Rhodocyclaceae bacterium]
MPFPSHNSDPTGLIDLENPQAALQAMDALLRARFGEGYGAPVLAQAVDDVARAFRGEYPGLLRCDTHYHDMRHALDAGLAMTRLIDGHCSSVAESDPERLDAEHALLGVLLTLYHDIGLLRRPDEEDLEGASLTPIHERRGVHFMERYLPNTPLAHLKHKAELIMITRLDYKMRPDWQGMDRTIARLMGAADLMSQLSDRCYLEKCRDFLFIEFSAIGLTGPGNPYPDAETLLRKTPAFYSGLLRRRIHDEYDDSDKYMAAHFGGHCPYIESIDRNFGYLEDILAAEDFGRLRRVPQRVIDAR